MSYLSGKHNALSIILKNNKESTFDQILHPRVRHVGHVSTARVRAFDQV